MERWTRNPNAVDLLEELKKLIEISGKIYVLKKIEELNSLTQMVENRAKAPEAGAEAARMAESTNAAEPTENP